MASWRIEWKPSAIKEVRRLPKETAARIIEAVTALGNDPFPPGCRKLAGEHSAWRIREGTYRIVYTVAAEVLLIHVIRVAHRKDVYR
jgi:mRNA interferase RelE/StbE